MSRLRRFVFDRQYPSAVVVLTMSVVTAYLLFAIWAMSHTSFDVWGGIIVAPVLLAATVPLARGAARWEQDPSVARLVMLACVAKLLGTVARYYLTFSLYGTGDADGYHFNGRHLANLFRQGDFVVDIGRRVMGTGFIEITTGIVYTVTGATKLGGFFVYSWLGFIGLFLFYRAFRIAFPDGDGRRYAYLVFFMPSLLFWPSSIGKESWMMLTIGLACYGAARLLAGSSLGLPPLVLGIAGTIMVRPHISLILIVSLFAAYLLRKPKAGSLLGLPAKVLVLCILAAGTVVVLGQFENFFGVKSVDSQSTDQILSRTTEQSSQGGSEVEVTRPTSPVGIAQGVVAVVFRPWPYESGNMQGLVASLEGVFVLGLILTSFRRLAALPRAMVQRPYVAFALSYSLLFAYAFSAIGNFGILSRQRVQLYPLLLVLLCIPAGYGKVTRSARGTKQPPSARDAEALSL